MSQHLPAVKPKDVQRALQRVGFELHHVRGSYYVFKHKTDPIVRVTVPWHNRDSKLRTLTAIIETLG